MMVKFWVSFLCLVYSINIADVRADGTPKNCKDVLKNGGRTTGVYQIQTKNGPKQVLCDQKAHDGGWVVFQQRYNDGERFWDRTWKDYAQGFGSVGENQNFYLGNDLISELTQQFNSNSTLRVELYDDRNPGSPHANSFYYTEYYFTLGDVSTDYTMKIFLMKDWMNPVGNASNGWYDITYSNGVKFSTIDHVNDPDKDCQPKYHMGGWWNYYCGLASLNGEYTPEHFGDGYGLFFTIAGQYVINPRVTKMMVRNDFEN